MGTGGAAGTRRSAVAALVQVPGDPGIGQSGLRSVELLGQAASVDVEGTLGGHRGRALEPKFLTSVPIGATVAR